MYAFYYISGCGIFVGDFTIDFGPYVAVVIFMIMIFAEIAWVVIEHNVMKKRMIKGK